MKLFNQINTEVILDNQPSQTSYDIIYDMVTLNHWIAIIRNTGLFFLNTKTDNNINIITANLVGLYFAVKPNKAAYLPLEEEPLNSSKPLDSTQVLAALKPVIEDPVILKIGYETKFTIGILKRYNIELAGLAFDIMLESYVLDNTSGKHDIVSLAARYLYSPDLKKQNIVVKNSKKLNVKDNHSETASNAAKNANLTLLLHEKLWPSIKNTTKIKKIFEEIDMPLVPVLSRIERTGVLIDRKLLLSHSLELNKRLLAIELAAHQLAKESFNLSSTKQLQTILYEKQKMPVVKKTPKGIPSTNEEVLHELSRDYPLPKLILEYRRLFHLKSSYTDKLPRLINPLSQRVHTSYNQAITATGRLSSSAPNLQNIPIRNCEGRRIRQAFIAPPDYLIVAADYSQIELRIMAHLSRDSSLFHAFSLDQDIHSATAAEVFSIELNQVTPTQRATAKAINFGLIYGISEFGLARKLSVPRCDAQKYMKLYFERYSGVLDYINNIRQLAIKQGYVSTIDGRLLYLHDINMLKGNALRAAINAPIQGTAADIIKRAMISIDSWLQKDMPPVRMIMQVHDELVFEVQRDIVENVYIQIKALMESCFQLDVPLKVDIGIGENWEQAH